MAGWAHDQLPSPVQWVVRVHFNNERCSRRPETQRSHELWKERRGSNVLSLGPGDDEGRAHRALKQKRLHRGPCTIHRHARPGLLARPESAEMLALSLQFICISNQVALTGGRGIPGKKRNYEI